MLKGRRQVQKPGIKTNLKGASYVDGKFASDHRLIEADIRLRFGIQKEQPIPIEPPGRISDPMHKYDVLEAHGTVSGTIWDQSGELYAKLRQITAGDQRPSKLELDELRATTETSMHHLADYCIRGRNRRSWEYTKQH